MLAQHNVLHGLFKFKGKRFNNFTVTVSDEASMKLAALFDDNITTCVQMSTLFREDLPRKLAEKLTISVYNVAMDRTKIGLNVSFNTDIMCGSRKVSATSVFP